MSTEEILREIAAEIQESIDWNSDKKNPYPNSDCRDWEYNGLYVSLEIVERYLDRYVGD